MNQLRRTVRALADYLHGFREVSASQSLGYVPVAEDDNGTQLVVRHWRYGDEGSRWIVVRWPLTSEVRQELEQDLHHLSCTTRQCFDSEGLFYFPCNDKETLLRMVSLILYRQGLPVRQWSIVHWSGTIVPLFPADHD